MARRFQILVSFVGVLFFAFVIVGTTRASDEPQIIHVTMKDNYIALSRFSFVPGKAVEFQVANEGTMPHRFIVEPYVSTSATNEVEAPVIAAGTAQMIQRTLAPGIYRVTCDRWDHAARGMVSAFAVDTPSQKNAPVPIEFIIPMLGLALGSAYLLWDSLGLSLTLGKE